MLNVIWVITMAEHWQNNNTSTKWSIILDDEEMSFGRSVARVIVSEPTNHHKWMQVSWAFS